jgi:hypothetical protein
MAAPTHVLHNEGSYYVEADTVLGTPHVWVAAMGRTGAFITPAKARELAQALTAHAEQADRLPTQRASEQMRNALVRAAIKQAPRRFDGSAITGFGEL